ncbi:MAG TPA: hypothetical protein PLY52_03225 [Methanothrix sp.]|jgi:hypothetical protein|uniref:hypothetical protein n=1 Tax=Methanothrix sp. TaxID=90426 RepID=UPI002CC25902|nr:hypothetical protein [Methanothrix sp.]HON35308.1 hypothetical protein [Methanothrix sp.]HRU76033.1 hypothetical protein [Methanothrix sp.]
MSLREEFERMTFEQKVYYLMESENRSALPDDLIEESISVLVQAGEIEYAAALARDRGMIDEAIRILVDAGDYLWAALIAKNAGRTSQSRMLYQDGIQYYIDMEMFGRAVSAATALGLPADRIDALFHQGIVSESRGMDLEHSRGMIESVLESLDISLIGREDEISLEIMRSLREEREKRQKEDMSD